MDFDETVGVSENYILATKDGKTVKIASADWPNVGEGMIEEGWTMDFTDFNKVTDGKPGPLFDKLKKWNAGCPAGKVRMHGSQCGFIRGPFGCCRKQLHFSDLKLGGRKTKKH